ncbi:MAG: hypothetical protein IJC15_06900 [Clostridia bacterium]|nr:hypothetical protein [Clostridia bacterium]
MTREELYTAIGGIRDELIEKAENHKFRRRLPIARFGALAAGLALLIGVGAGIRYIPIGGGAGGGGNTGRTYMSYAGPIFPLTTLEEAALTAEREVVYDFSPYTDYADTYEDSRGEMQTHLRYEDEVIVTDSYTLSNPTAADLTLTAVYPFAADLRCNLDRIPTLTCSGETVDAALYIGPYSGGFTAVHGDEARGGRYNLAGASSWEDYAALLASGEYLADAMAALPALEQTVVVYEISQPICTDTEASNPTLNFETEIDYSRTTVLTYGMNGGRHDPEGGHLARHFSIPEEWEPQYGKSVYLLVLGEDLTDYRLQGYADGGCDEGEEIEASATVTRYEATLREMLLQFGEDYLDFSKDHSDAVEADCLLDIIGLDTFIGLCGEMMYSFGVFSDDPAERYTFNDIESYFSETGSMGRVIYLALPLTVPAGETVTLTAVMHKDASIDFVGSRQGRDGYDLVTQLGSKLEFTAQYAAIASAELIEIIEQNFGFDPSAGITRVALDPAQPHYWMDVRKRTAEPTA